MEQNAGKEIQTSAKRMAFQIKVILKKDGGDHEKSQSAVKIHFHDVRRKVIPMTPLSSSE